jgi:hypothetical protein
MTMTAKYQRRSQATVPATNIGGPSPPATLAAARTANPAPFTSSTAPKILQVPNAAWINPPAQPAQPAA